MTTSLQGLYSGFEGHRTPRETDLATLLQDGLIALDTNVLLNLYKFNDRSRTEFISVLSALSERLFLPHEVMSEFWSNRVQVLATEIETSSSGKTLNPPLKTTLGLISAWRVRTNATEAEADVLCGSLREFYASLGSQMEAVGSGLDLAAALADTDQDQLLAALEPMLLGVVGQPFTPEERVKQVAEGVRRFAKSIPPGYLDAKKTGQKAEGTGDFLLWEQLLRHAQQAGKDVVLVTNDSKPDWWRRGAGNDATLGPRVELVEEFRARTGQRFHLLLPKQFLQQAGQYLNVEISQTTLLDFSRMSEPVEEEDQALEGDWTNKYIEILLEQLRATDDDLQADIIDEASRSDGSISRQRVLELAGLPEDHRFRQFIAPATRALRLLAAAGELPMGLEQPLWSYYEGSSKRTTSFEVPDSMVLARLASGSARTTR